MAAISVHNSLAMCQGGCVSAFASLFRKASRRLSLATLPPRLCLGFSVGGIAVLFCSSASCCLSRYWLNVNGCGPGFEGRRPSLSSGFMPFFDNPWRGLDWVPWPVSVSSKLKKKFFCIFLPCSFNLGHWLFLLFQMKAMARSLMLLMYEALAGSPCNKRFVYWVTIDWSLLKCSLIYTYSIYISVLRLRLNLCILYGVIAADQRRPHKSRSIFHSSHGLEFPRDA